MSLSPTLDKQDSPVSLTSQVYDGLRADIIAGKLKPALKLKVEELRKRYNVGASPVREALSLLASDGLVDRIDQRGFRVAVVSAEDFADILNVRCWLEERALRESIKKGDTAWEEAVVLAFFRISKEPRSIGDKDHFVANPQWERLHKEFHLQLISACGSPTLLEICDRLYDRNVRYRNLAGPVSYPKRDINSEHQDIMDASLARDEDAAVECLIAHYQNTGGFLERKID
ncbi:MAG: GntR family transcriptional regulator [Hyphomicrobiales bacterium]